MAPTSISITAPARLHFGLLSFGDENLRQFGGAGLMLNEPSLQLHAEQSEDLSIEANPILAQRVANYVRQWQDYHQIHDSPRCKIQLLKSPEQHTGLGLGTQLGLSVVVGFLIGSGLDKWLKTEPYFLIIFGIAGIIAGYRSIFRLVKKIQRDP